MRDFASALISNKLGGLSVQSGHTPADNVAIELAVHLAVILLTTNNDLLRPLKQLGLFPDNMQVFHFFCCFFVLNLLFSECLLLLFGWIHKYDLYMDFDILFRTILKS